MKNWQKVLENSDSQYVPEYHDSSERQHHIIVDIKTANQDSTQEKHPLVRYGCELRKRPRSL